jgi:hypothetical protein
MRQIGLAVALFLINAALSVWWMWDARPRTVYSMDPMSVDSGDKAAVDSALKAAELTAHDVLVCEVEPCTEGPSIFVFDGKIVRVDLSDNDGDGPLMRHRP